MYAVRKFLIETLIKAAIVECWNTNDNSARRMLSMTSNLLRSGECKMEVTEKSSYLNRTGSVFYIGRHCEKKFYGYQTLDDDVPASSKIVYKLRTSIITT